MKVIVRSRPALLHDSELTLGMHRLRGRVFKDRLDWDVSVSNGLEIDQYDTFKPTYLLALERTEVVGCVRLLPTTGRNMLADTFPVLLDGNPAPKATTVWESSRFCVDTKTVAATAENGLRKATFLLFAAMIEWGQQRDLQAIATVTDLRMERILRRAGWHLDRLGTPRQIGPTKAVAGLLPVTDKALDAIRAAGQISGHAIDAPSSLAIAA
ncbi:MULTISPECIES: acyl-homoserine-lactone synthase [unclassified Bradyrhizobium]|jgi:acyl homoserine lactone synthase|uniref:acyl-homoserine-lactone synthase n=1 Tax=unclassified Bradyrhizobium TaxID=2631580 RepID=UPI00070E32F7|nr:MULTISPECIES: acyl-homoserine-lactone synthase [unclassified Bradyrhizobium]KQT20791.1 conjugal transfer protein TraI [Bradyrhizobium sp. Leaf396]